MPESASFPSGPAASAFAFAYAVGRHLPGLAVPIRLLAAGVVYSRVHVGVHYPGDVVIGSVLGAGTAAVTAAACDRFPSRPDQHGVPFRYFAGTDPVGRVRAGVSARWAITGWRV